MPSEQDYPQSFEFQGEIMTLSRETRWNRAFTSTNGKKQLRRSRFQDGSATITFSQLATEWGSWTEDERKDFCNAIGWLAGEDRDAIFRFLIKNTDFRLLHNNALTLARYLPTSESVPWLVQCIEHCAAGEAIAYIQALAWIKAPDAINFFHGRLAKAWNHPEMFRHDSFMNWIAVEAINCIDHLIELGCSPLDYKDQAASLSEHPCTRVRQNYQSTLAKHYN